MTQLKPQPSNRGHYILQPDQYQKMYQIRIQQKKETYVQRPVGLVMLCLVESNSLHPHGLQPTRLLCLWGFSRQEYWRGLLCPPPKDLPNSGIKLKSCVIQADSLLSEPPGKVKNTGVGSLSLLQGIFLAQELNRGLLCCRWILYHLSYQGSY